MEDKKYILIVGASSGIGSDIAKHLAGDKTVLFLMARRKDKLTTLQKQLNGPSEVVVCDITKNEDIQSFFLHIKEEGIKFNAMIYTAGVCYKKPVKTMLPGEIEDLFKVNIFGFYEICRWFQSSAISERGASIVALSSYASISKERGMSAYAMSKAAMNTAVEIMAKEFIKRKIRVNAILPANTTSVMGREEDFLSDEEQERILEQQPLGVISIQEISELVAFLISEKASHITGALLEVSAGYEA